MKAGQECGGDHFPEEVMFKLNSICQISLEGRPMCFGGATGKEPGRWKEQGRVGGGACRYPGLRGPVDLVWRAGGPVALEGSFAAVLGSGLAGLGGVREAAEEMRSW